MFSPYQQELNKNQCSSARAHRPRCVTAVHEGASGGDPDLPLDDTVDLLIIGGGVNGAGIARDAVGRGLSVVLTEQADLASGTSSASSKMIHGGLRYLEHYAFGLVRKALIERETLLEIAPHLIEPMRFVLPHDASLRPAWMIRAGLFLYDHLGARKRLPGCRSIDLGSAPEGAPLRDHYTTGFVYSDCWVDDSRLVVLNALAAAEQGATILTRSRCVSARRDGDAWLATLREMHGFESHIRARALVNAAGPWVDEVLEHTDRIQRREKALRLVKGSHIVVNRAYQGSHAYILQNHDRRVIFALPFQDCFTLIGTTDIPFDGDPTRVTIDAGEIDYLCQAYNRSFASPIGPADVVWSYAGVRPLYDDEAGDPSSITRDYKLELDGGPGKGPPLVNVLGGKITTYRLLAEQVLNLLCPIFPGLGLDWTAAAPLPGGDMPDADFEAFLERFRAARPWLPDGLARRLARAYGTRAGDLLGDAKALDDLGHDFSAGLYAREVDYLTRHEWARNAEDILWRRSKLGLHCMAGTEAALEGWLAGETPMAATAQ